MTGFISALFLVFCGVFYSSNKTAFIWTLFGGVAFGLFTGFLYWQNDIWKSEANISPVAQFQKNEENSDKNNSSAHAPSSSKSNKGPKHAIKSELKQPAFSEKGDIQPRKESVLELSTRYPDIGAVIKGTKTYQELSPEAQVVYIKEKAKIELAKLIINDPRFTPEQITRILQQSSVSNMKKSIEVVIGDEIKLTDEIEVIKKPSNRNPEYNQEENLKP